MFKKGLVKDSLIYYITQNAQSLLMNQFMKHL